MRWKFSTDFPQFQGNVSCLDVRASHSAGCWGIVLKLFHCVSYLLCPKVCWSWWCCRIIGYQEGFYLISKISPANEISSEKGPHLCTWKISSTFERLKGGPNWRAPLRLFGGCLPVSLSRLPEVGVPLKKIPRMGVFEKVPLSRLPEMGVPPKKIPRMSVADCNPNIRGVTLFTSHQKRLACWPFTPVYLFTIE